MRDRQAKREAQQAAQAKYRAGNKLAQRKLYEKRKSTVEKEKDSVERLTSIYNSAMRAIE